MQVCIQRKVNLVILEHEEVLHLLIHPMVLVCSLFHSSGVLDVRSKYEGTNIVI
jgi:hypothetical protein